MPRRARKHEQAGGYTATVQGAGANAISIRYTVATMDQAVASCVQAARDPTRLRRTVPQRGREMLPDRGHIR